MGNNMMGASNDLMRRKEGIGGGGMAPPFAPPMGMATNGMPQPGMATGGFNGVESPMQMRGGDPNGFLGHVLGAAPPPGSEKSIVPGAVHQEQLGLPGGSATTAATSGIGPSSASYADSQNYQRQRANSRRGGPQGSPRRLGMF